jgi:hypothetical protein
MTRRFFGFLGALTGLALVSGSCVDDPLADLDGAPTAVLINYELLVQAIGDQDTVSARVVDGRFTPLALPITYTACDADIVVTANASYNPVPPTSVQFVVRAVTPGASCVVVSAGGVSDTLAVGVLPVAFGGTLSATTPQGGDTLTIGSTTELKFDTATVAVTFGGAQTGTIVAKTPDQLKVLVPFSSAAPLVIAGINVTYVPGLITALTTASTVTQTGDRWGTGDTSYTTAPTIDVPATAGTSFRMVTAFGPTNNTNCAEFGPAPPNGSIGPCVIYRFDLAAPATLRLSADWNSSADIDIYVCGNTGLPGCFESGGSGAGSSKPEAINAFAYAAGTHYFVIERWSGTLPTNLVLTIARQ